MFPRRLSVTAIIFVLLLGGMATGDAWRAGVTTASPGAVTVREPAFGLPHIYAHTDLELARENGREIAKDRLGQLILLSRVGRGTLYQAFGSLDPSTFGDDVEARREGYTSSELNNMFQKLPSDMQALVLEYCKGVNDTIDAIYAGTLPEPLEVGLFRGMLDLGDDLFGNATNISDQVDPYYKAPGGADPEHPNGGFQFTPELAMAVGILEVRTFGSESFGEVSRLNELNKLLDKFPVTGGEIWDDLNFLNDPLAPVSVPDPATPGFGGPLASGPARENSPTRYVQKFPDYDYDAALEPVQQRRAHREAFARALGAWPALGSYAWMIDGERSAGGNPWIGGFPQTGIQTPSIMHFVENRSAEGADHRIQAMGMEFPGAPLILIGQTDNVAYTTTTAQLKNNDFYLDKLILENTDALRYSDEGTPAQVNKRTDQIKAPGGSTTPIVVWRTHERAGNDGSRTVEAFQGDASGAADSATATSLTDSGAFGGDFSGGSVAIVRGTGAGQMRPILSNTSDTLTLDAGDAWTTTPDSSSEYVAVKSGHDIVVISRERVFWLEESTTVFGFSFMQRAESILDIRAGLRMMPNTHNFLAADNQAFNGIGTDLGPSAGNIGYWSSGFSRVRQGASPTDTRLPMDGTVANELVVVGGTVDSATVDTLTSSGVFTGKDFSPPPFNFRLDNPSQKGSEYIVAITGGDGYKQTRRIAGNTNDTLTLEEDWGVVPSPGDLFEVYEIVAIPEAINPPEGYSANWNNKAATADDGRGFGRQFRSAFILERLAAESTWTRDEQRQLNKDLAGLDGSGKYGRYLLPRLREAVDGVGNGGNPDVDTVLAALEAHNGSPEFGRHFIDPVADTMTAGELAFLNDLVNRLSSAIYGDEFSGSGVGTPTGSTALNLVQHAIDDAAGNPAGRYGQSYSGDYFNGSDWRVVVRDAFSQTITDLGGIPADSPRPNDTYAHPLSVLYPSLVFDPTPTGNRGVWEQIVEVGPVVLGEFVFPLGQSGFASTGGVPDANADSLHPVWRDWRFVPMLHVAEDLAVDPDGDVDNDGVLDGFEKWYFGSTSPLSTDDIDGDGATLLTEYLNGSDPTDPDTDGGGAPDGVDAAPFGNPQDRLDDDDVLLLDNDFDGLSNGDELNVHGTDPLNPDTDGGGAPDGLEVDYGYNPLDSGDDHFLTDDDDGDGCSNFEEEYLFGYDAADPYDVFDAPVPVREDAVGDGYGDDLPPIGPNGPRNKLVDIGDVLAVLFYTFADDEGPPNANGVDYDADKGVDTDGDTVADIPPDSVDDGLSYDRSPGDPPVNGFDPAGPPNGVIDMGDVLAVLAQAYVVDCSGLP